MTTSGVSEDGAAPSSSVEATASGQRILASSARRPGGVVASGLALIGLLLHATLPAVGDPEARLSPAASDGASFLGEDGPPDLVLDLDSALALALGGNLSIRKARHAYAASASQVRAAENRFDFKLGTLLGDQRSLLRHRELTGGAGVDVTRDIVDDSQEAALELSREVPWGGRFDLGGSLVRSRTHGFTTLSEPAHVATWSVAYTQPLVAGRGRRVATAALVTARLQHVAEGRSLAESETRLVVDVIRSCHDVLRARSLVAITDTAVRQASERLRTTELRLEEGLITPIDLARAERDLRSRESSLLSARESQRAAVDTLAFVLGLEPGVRIEVTEPAAFAPVPLDLEASVSEALASRADVLDQRERVTLTVLAADVAHSLARPRLDVTLHAEFRNLPGREAADFFEVAPEDDWVSGLTFSHVFGERSDDEAYARARIAEDVAALDLVELERRVAIEVRDAVRALRTLESRIAVLERNVELAKESFRLATLQFGESLITTTDLLADQDQVVSAEIEHVNALLDHAVATARLDLVLGHYRATPTGRESPHLRPTGRTRQGEP